MYKLAPSILSADFTILGEQIKTLEESGVEYLHVDVMDGHFVPNISLGLPVIKSIRKSTNMVFDVHLMISDPDFYIERFAEAGADIINFHVEASKNIEDSLKKIKALGKKAALTVKPKTDLSLIYNHIELLDMVLIMSVEPGFGGQKLIPETLDKARELRSFINKNKLNIDIEMDGGIYTDNLYEVLDSGVNIVVSGSGVFGESDIRNAVNKFNKLFLDYTGDKN